MRKVMLSEKELVVVLFVMVLITFYFAQADSSKIEKMFLNTNPTVTTSIDRNPVSAGKTKDIQPFIPALQLR